MAQFRATIEGARGDVSRLGTKKSGLTVRVNGWNVGVSVRIWHNEKTGLDNILIDGTGGSNDSQHYNLSFPILLVEWPAKSEKAEAMV